MSAGRELELGTRLGASLLGPSEVAWVVKKIIITKRIMANDAIPVATTSHLVVTIDVSQAATLVGNTMEGHPQPALDRQDESANALEWVSGAEERRLCSVASSMAKERGFWRRGTSTSSRLVQSGRAVAEARAARVSCV